MKTQVQKIDGSKRELTIEVTGEVVKNKFEDVFKKITQEAKVSGFRPGHAPRDVIEKNFSGHAHEQVLKELIPELYDAAIAKEGLEAVELPEISDVKLDRNTLFFKALVEISPDVPLKDYKGIKVEYNKINVTADEIKRSIDSLKESRKAEIVDDNFAHTIAYPSVSELEKAIERQIYLQKENSQRQKVEQHIIDAISKDVNFTIPQAIIRRQLNDLVRQAKLDLALKGVAKDQIAEQEAKITEGLEAEAKEQVRIYLIMSAIAKKENIPDDNLMPRKVMELLLGQAEWKIV